MIYLALFSIIITGGLISAYSLIESSYRNQTKAMVQEEGSFLIGKIDWALTGTQTISLPTANTFGTTLSLVRYEASTSPVVITIVSGNMTIKVGTNPTHVLNNTNVQISCPPTGCFTHSSATADGINPENATASFTISSKTSQGFSTSQFFSTVKYLRK
jgi:hypothetical protein